MSTRNPRNNALLAFMLLAVAGFLSVSALVRTASGAEIVVSETQQLHHGKVLYTTYCTGCHGEAGDGKGPAASMLIIKPRDFTSGLYKFRSTPNGQLPTDADLMRTLTKGVNRTSMPEWSLLPERERMALVQYVKSFYPGFKDNPPPHPIYVPAPPATLGSPESIARGRQLYEMLECGRCHGPKGLGDGPSAATLAPDSWGNPQKPFNFTKGALKSGAAPEDVYRTFMTGLNGTAMPSYADVFDEPDGENIKPGDAWNLVSYVLSLRANDGPGTQVASEQGAAVNAAYRGDLARAGYTAPAPEPAPAGGNKESKP
jgi:cytochrome c oxidase cbb3-type subunit I/II